LRVVNAITGTFIFIGKRWLKTSKSVWQSSDAN
jgi:hypothetical protein